MLTPRPASSSATTAPIRLAPVRRATVFFRSMKGPRLAGPDPLLAAPAPLALSHHRENVPKNDERRFEWVRAPTYDPLTRWALAAMSGPAVMATIAEENMKR